MTDTERERINAICKVAHVNEIDDLSDGSHTFRQLYYQRMMLFATIVKQNGNRAWKSLRHEDGELCFGGEWFIVGIDTPEGSYTYHYENAFYSLFDCKELQKAKHWDGHTEEDVTRLLSLPSARPEIIRCKDCKHWIQKSCESDDMWMSMYEDVSAFARFNTDGDFFCGYAERRTKETDYERAVEQLEHDMLYEPTFNQDDGSM